MPGYESNSSPSIWRAGCSEAGRGAESHAGAGAGGGEDQSGGGESGRNLHSHGTVWAKGISVHTRKRWGGDYRSSWTGREAVEPGGSCLRGRVDQRHLCPASAVRREKSASPAGECIV